MTVELKEREDEMDAVSDLCELGREANPGANAKAGPGGVCQGSEVGISAAAFDMRAVQGGASGDSAGTYRVAREAKVNETMLIVTIKHAKALPSKMNITDIVSERTYNWLNAQGVSADVRASLVPQKPDEWELSHKEKRND
jgi:hypothetical protein